MNAIDFIRESAKTLTAYRPDVYDMSSAVQEVSTAMDALREYDRRPVSSIMFTSFILTRMCEDDMEEFILSRKLTGLLICEEEETVEAYSYDRQIDGLPHIMDRVDDDPDDMLD